MNDSLFMLTCGACERDDRPSRLWVRASIDVSSSEASTRRSGDTHHYIECMNCGIRFKCCENDAIEDVDDDEWKRFVDEVEVVAKDVGSLR